MASGVGGWGDGRVCVCVRVGWGDWSVCVCVRVGCGEGDWGVEYVHGWVDRKVCVCVCGLRVEKVTYLPNRNPGIYFIP